MVNVDYPVGKVVHKLRTQDLHVLRQQDVVDAQFFEQLGFLLLLLGFVLFVDGKMVKRNAKHIGVALHLGVVADDDADLGVPLPDHAALHDVEEAVGRFGHEHGELIDLVAEAQFEVHIELFTDQRAEVFFDGASGNQEVFQVPLDAHEEHAVELVDALVHPDDVTSVGQDKAGYFVDDAGAVLAGEFYDCGQHGLLIRQNQKAKGRKELTTKGSKGN